MTAVLRWWLPIGACLMLLAGVAVAQPTPALPADWTPGPRAPSNDGLWLMAADARSPRLVLFDADQRIHGQWQLATLDGKTTSPASALRHDPARRSFVVALRDVPELWEISLDPNAEPIYDGLVHDYRMREAIAKPGHLGVRLAPLELPLADFVLDPTGRLAIGIPRGGPDGLAALWAIHLDVRRRIARVALAGLPDLTRAAFLTACGRGVLAVPVGEEGRVQQVDLATWRLTDPPLTPHTGDACPPEGQAPG